MNNWTKTFVRGWILWWLLLVPRIIGELRLLWMINSGDLAGAKKALHGVDICVNATALRGSPYETVSSHCGRVQTTWWAKGIIWITDRVDQPGHCVGANKKEQPILDMIESMK